MDTHRDQDKISISISDLHRAVETLSISQLVTNAALNRLLDDQIDGQKIEDLAELRSAIERSSERLQKLTELFLGADYGS